MTPAVVAASAFLALAAVTSVSFVVVRGGLELPTAPTRAPAAPTQPGAAQGTAAPSAIALASAAPTPGGAQQPSPAPESTSAPTITPVPEPTTGPTPGATPEPTPGPRDPLLALAPCPGFPGCYLYVVRRGDTFGGVSDRFRLELWITRALNPEVGADGAIVVGQTLYLGRDPEARLPACPDGAQCRLYTVRSGDTVSGIADRYGVPEAGILALNRGLSPGTIIVGQVIRLPLYA